jgi:hypothetical protein
VLQLSRARERAASARLPRRHTLARVNSPHGGTLQRNTAPVGVRAPDVSAMESSTADMLSDPSAGAESGSDIVSPAARPQNPAGQHRTRIHRGDAIICRGMRGGACAGPVPVGDDTRGSGRRDVSAVATNHRKSPPRPRLPPRRPAARPLRPGHRGAWHSPSARLAPSHLAATRRRRAGASISSKFSPREARPCLPRARARSRQAPQRAVSATRASPLPSHLVPYPCLSSYANLLHRRRPCGASIQPTNFATNFRTAMAISLAARQHPRPSRRGRLLRSGACLLAVLLLHLAAPGSRAAEQNAKGKDAEGDSAEGGDAKEDDGLANAKYTVVTHTVPRPPHRTDFVRMRDKVSASLLLGVIGGLLPRIQGSFRRPSSAREGADMWRGAIWCRPEPSLTACCRRRLPSWKTPSRCRVLLAAIAGETPDR